MLYVQGDSALQAILASCRFSSAVSLYNLFLVYQVELYNTSRGVKRKKKKFPSFIVASFNAQSVKGNDMACKRCEISTFIKDNGVDLFL